MKTCFCLWGILSFFASCGGNAPNLDVVDDSFFEGKIGALSDQLLNSSSTKWIFYNPATGYDTHSWVSVHVDLSSLERDFRVAGFHRLSISIPEPLAGGKYVAKRNLDDQSAYLRYLFTERLANEDEIWWDRNYLPYPSRSPLTITVLKVDENDMMELELKGYVYRDIDMQDSVELNAKIRARSSIPLVKK